MKMSRILKVMVVALVVTALGIAASGSFAQSGPHTSSQFQGPKANKGTVTHSTKDGKSVLTLSDDFVVPDTPGPALAGCRFRRKRLPAGQTQDQGVHRHELQEGNRAAQLRKERSRRSSFGARSRKSILAKRTSVPR